MGKIKLVQDMTDEELEIAIEQTKSVAGELADEEKQRRILHYEELKKLRAKSKINE